MVRLAFERLAILVKPRGRLKVLMRRRGKGVALEAMKNSISDKGFNDKTDHLESEGGLLSSVGLLRGASSSQECIQHPAPEGLASIMTPGGVRLKVFMRR